MFKEVKSLCSIVCFNLMNGGERVLSARVSGTHGGSKHGLSSFCNQHWPLVCFLFAFAQVLAHLLHLSVSLCFKHCAWEQYMDGFCF